MKVCGRDWTERRSGWCRAPRFAAQAALTSPALAPILQAYPAGTSPTSNPSVWNYDAPGRQIDNEDSGMIRLDHYFSDRTTAFVRFNADEAVEIDSHRPTDRQDAVRYQVQQRRGCAFACVYARR